MGINQNDIAQFDKLPDSAFVRLRTVTMLNGCVDRATIYKWVAAGTFPAPRKLGPQVSAWNVGELRRHLGLVAAA